jgi:hypothetical protein
MRGFLCVSLSAVGLIAMGGCGSDSTAEDTGLGAVKSPHYVKTLTAPQIRALEGAALGDRQVHRLVAGSNPKVVEALRWSGEDSPLLGVAVYLRLDPPIDLNKQALPAYLTPNPQAPSGTPNLRRKVIYSSRGVKVLKVRVLAVGREVAEIQPASAESSESEWLGPPPGDDYAYED